MSVPCACCSWKGSKTTIRHRDREALVRASSFVLAIGLVIATTAVPDPVIAQQDTESGEPIENFELSLFPPVQLRGEGSAIRILRLGLYNKNLAVRGLDIGVVNHSTGDVSKGFQWGLVGFVEGAFMGWQNNILVNINTQEFVGMQGLSLYNEIDWGEAFQFGIFNRARDISGFQLGIVNWAENMHGVQIGLINIISGKENLQFLPIVNWSF